MLPYVTGPLIWFGHFVTVYAGESLFCGRPHTLLVAAATLVALALLARPLLRGPGAIFSTQVGFGLTLLALLGIGWSVLAALMLPACTLLNAA